MIDINPNHFNKVLFKFLYRDEIFFKNTMDFFDPNIFSEDYFKISYKFFKEFYNKFSKIPNIEEIKISISNKMLLDNLNEAFEYISDINIESLDTKIFYNQAEKYIKEQLVLLSFNNIINNINTEPLNPEKIVMEFSKISNIRLSRENGYDFYEDFNKYKEFLKEKNERIPTDFLELDKVMNGGYPTDGRFLGIIAAPPNIGKSIMLGNIAVNTAKQGKNVLVISLEMSEMVYATRLYSNMYKMSINKLNFELDILEDKLKNKVGGIIIKEFPPATMTVENIDAYINNLIKDGNKIDAIFIDYAQLLKEPSASSSYESGVIISQKLRALSYIYNTSIWTCNQINRMGMEGKPQMQHFAESIGPCATADFILSLYQLPEDITLNIMRCAIIKNRLGVNGISIDLYFNHESLCFENMKNSNTNELPKEQQKLMLDLESIESNLPI